MYLLDLSYHNEFTEDVKEQILKDKGLIFRIMWGTNKDEKQAEYLEFCEENNIDYGVYIYSYALNVEGVKSEVKYFKDNFSHLNAKLGVWFDMEDADGYKTRNGMKLSSETITPLCDTFISEMSSYKGLKGIYASLNWFNIYIKTECEKWVAHWHKNDGTRTDEGYQYHQYTSKYVLGVKWHDRNYFRDIILEEVKSNEDYATEVIKGIYGNGQDRIDNLQDVGVSLYDVALIQLIVNERMNTTLEDYATEVIKGTYGNGQDRIDNLEKKGLTANEIEQVQSIVNERMNTRLEDYATEVIKGTYGNDQERVEALGKAGLTASEIIQVQSIVNERLA